MEASGHHYAMQVNYALGEEILSFACPKLTTDQFPLLTQCVIISFETGGGWIQLLETYFHQVIFCSFSFTRLANKTRRVDSSRASLLKMAPTAEERNIVHDIFLNTLDPR